MTSFRMTLIAAPTDGQESAEYPPDLAAGQGHQKTPEAADPEPCGP